MLRKVEAELLTRNLLNNTTWRNRERGKMSRFAKLEIKTVDEHKTSKWPTWSQKSLGETTDMKSEVMEEDETKDFEWK